jgi:hypothetical protein
MTLQKLLIILIIFQSLSGCTLYVIRNYGGGYKKIVGDRDSIYLYQDKILIGGNVVLDNVIIGEGYGEFPQNEWDHEKVHEVSEIYVGAIPNEATKVHEGINYTYDTKNKLWSFYIYNTNNKNYDLFYYKDYRPHWYYDPATRKVTPRPLSPEFSRSVIPRFDGFVASRKWYRYIDTGLILLITGPLDILMFLIVMFAITHGG